MPFLLKLAALGGILLALLSAYPGVLDDLLLIAIVLAFFLIPVLVIGGVTFRVLQARLAKLKPRELDLDLSGEDIGVGKRFASPRRGLDSNLCVLFMCFALILTGIPRRISFLLSRSAFQRHVSTAPASKFGGEALGRFLGVYHVDKYAADPRGGVYFRTHAGPDGMGPDRISHGFVYKPNRQGTPFGRAGYNCSRIVGDWHVFSASNDY